MPDSLPAHIAQAHADALERGDEGYLDPDTGLFVMTAAALEERGMCCGSGCRHCPYPPDVQREAGRPMSEPTAPYEPARLGGSTRIS